MKTVSAVSVAPNGSVLTRVRPWISTALVENRNRSAELDVASAVKT